MVGLNNHQRTSFRMTPIRILLWGAKRCVRNCWRIMTISLEMYSKLAEITILKRFSSQNLGAAVVSLKWLNTCDPDKDRALGVKRCLRTYWWIITISLEFYSKLVEITNVQKLGSFEIKVIKCLQTYIWDVIPLARMFGPQVQPYGRWLSSPLRDHSRCNSHTFVAIFSVTILDCKKSFDHDDVVLPCQQRLGRSRRWRFQGSVYLFIDIEALVGVRRLRHHSFRSQSFCRVFTLPCEVWQGKPCHLYFDLEFNRRVNTEADGEAMVDLLLSEVETAFLDIYGLKYDPLWTVELDSSTQGLLPALVPWHAFHSISFDSIPFPFYLNVFTEDDKIAMRLDKFSSQSFGCFFFDLHYFRDMDFHVILTCTCLGLKLPYIFPFALGFNSTSLYL